MACHAGCINKMSKDSSTSRDITKYVHYYTAPKQLVEIVKLVFNQSHDLPHITEKLKFFKKENIIMHPKI